MPPPSPSAGLEKSGHGLHRQGPEVVEARLEALECDDRRRHLRGLVCGCRRLLVVLGVGVRWSCRWLVYGFGVWYWSLVLVLGVVGVVGVAVAVAVR